MKNSSAASSYIPLWCKSNYSFLEGASHPEELVAQAEALELPALAITDRDGVYGIVRAHVQARECKLKLIIGSQLTLEDDSHLVLLCQNRTGYANLCQLISAGRLRNPKGYSAVTWREICERATGLIALWGSGGLLAQPEDPIPIAGLLCEAFEDRLYVPLARHRRAEEADEESRLRSRAARHALPLLAAPEVLYHQRQRRELQDVLTCIRHNTTLAEAGVLLKANDQYDLKTPAVFSVLYQDLPAAVARTLEIADRCSFSLDDIRYRYPSEKLPGGMTSAQWLRELTLQGARKRYSGHIPDDVRAQLDKELALIDELDYCGYFLTMKEIVEYCRSQKILCQGRGSAANSAVCYCLGITAVDPVRMDLLFERFISRERAEPPDIDLDIEHQRREEVIQHVYDKYGRAHAAMVANFVRYRTRSAVRDVGKAIGLPLTALNRMSKLLPHYHSDLPEALSQVGLDAQNPAHSLLARLVREIVRTPRHLSIHPGGFILGSEPVASFVPVENATMPERTVIQWDKYDVEDMNLFKVDLLGLGALTHLDYCFQLLKKHRGVSFSMATIPFDDPDLFALVTRGDTVGVFQIESRAQMAMLPRLKPRCFYDLVIEISIVRPGPISGGMVHPYLRRRNGEEPVVYPHPALEPVLKKTLGVPLFQEQVMRLAVVAADYTPGEADQLRRDMAAWKISGRIERHREKLIRRMIKKGIAREFAERVYSQILGFGEYGFPESHAASFALIAYCTAWMKCHYPAEFTCGLLNAWPMGFYAPATIVEDAKRHGVILRAVDVLKSRWDCTLEPLPEDDRHGFAVRMGLRYVKGLGQGDYARIEAACRKKPVDLKSFVKLSRLDEAALAALAESGALVGFGVDRRTALWEISGTRPVAGEPVLEGSLNLKEREFLPGFDDLHILELIGWDYASTGHSTEGHPLEPFREELSRRGLPDAQSLSGLEDGSRVSYAGLVISRQRPMTANGVVFMTLEDESGFVNLILWKQVFEDFRTVILTNAFLGVSGKLQAQDGVVHLVVDSCWPPRLSGQPSAPESRDFH